MGKDPTSTSCEDLILQVTLPEATSVADVDVDLKPTRIIVRTGVQCALAISSALHLQLPVRCGVRASKDEDVYWLN